ncbi:c-type cytochrome [Arcobacter sp. FWKO B]|uniref:c-type cytochrome n=1 Tax=Arcobacter sp. FWKO B TaxID=2593672 RepID=UPI0018A34969|nr:c-type cytochrome [Arcobacter sp. FWKO B]QOG12695.1 c-type cytochrome [Arcobacter sp. FWKO B]
MKKVLLSCVAVASLSFASGDLYKAECASCHGANAEKKALGKSDVIAGWAEADIVTALNGYKDGSRNVHGMLAVKKPITSKLSDADIKSVASYISGLK